MVMDQSEQDLIRASMGQLLTRYGPADIPVQLIESGWTELLDSDPGIAVTVLAEEQGRSLTASPALDLVLQHGAGLRVDPNLAFVLPAIGRRSRPPGLVADGRAQIDGLVLSGHQRATGYLVSTDKAILAVPVGAVSLEPVRGADPDLGLARARGEVSGVDGCEVAGTAAWVDALAAGRRSLAGELTGLSERMLEDTVAYVLARQQFGRPIASFQTVKHRLADVRVAVSAATAGLEAAWDDQTATSALAAKCLAGRAHRLAAANCHQVHGGIAFTVEHGFHRFIRRGQVLDGLLGGADDLVVELGRQILDSQRVPRTPQPHL
jgi:hypothetical protein